MSNRKWDDTVKSSFQSLKAVKGCIYDFDPALGF
jgi:hypothetical protein